MTAGRPTKYKAEYCDQARDRCLLGATDRELADMFSIQESTLNLWKEKHPEFMEALREGKENADDQIAKSLYEKAKGGDTTAMIFWLKNRRKHHWRDKHNYELTGTGEGGAIETITRVIIDPKEKK